MGVDVGPAAHDLLLRRKMPFYPVEQLFQQGDLMILKQRIRNRSVVSVCLLLLVFVSGISLGAAQQKPTEFDSHSDDKQLCGTASVLGATEYCDFWRLYSTNRIGTDAASKAIAMDARNELIKYVQGRVDRFYEESANKKKFNRNLLQTILDVLEIGAATAIGISNGERAKSVIGISLGGLQAIRTSANKNFDLLQTRIIVNKMRENRAQILTRIVSNMDKPVSDYSWLAAKNDLRQYLYAGTFNNALDSLAAETGEAAQDAEKDLRIISGDLVLVRESTAASLADARNANKILDDLEKNLGDDTAKDAALTTLKAILEELRKDPDLKPLVEAGNPTGSSDGKAIITRLAAIRRQVAREGKGDLARKINQAVIRVNKVQ